MTSMSSGGLESLSSNHLRHRDATSKQSSLDTQADVGALSDSHKTK